MKILFSKNRYDSDGDIVEECIQLHIGDNLILEVKNVSEIETMIGSLTNICDEIRENY